MRKRLALAMVCALAALEGCSGGAMKAAKYFRNPQTAEMSECAARGDVAGVERAISAGGNPNEIGESGITPLLYVLSESKDKAGLRALVQHKADPNYRSPKGFCPLALAARMPDVEVLRVLLDGGGNPNLTDNDRRPLTHAAARQKQWQNMELLIERGADINATDPDGYTLVMSVAIQRQFDRVAQLIEKSADVTRTAGNGDSLAEITAEASIAAGHEQERARQQVIRLLAERGVRVPSPPK